MIFQEIILKKILTTYVMSQNTYWKSLSKILREEEKTRLNNLSTLFKDYPKKQKMVVARRLSESLDG